MYSTSLSDYRRGGGTEVVHWTSVALWRPRFADRPTMKDEQMRQQGPQVARHQDHQILLNCIGIFRSGQTQTLRQAFDMRIDRYALRAMEDIPQNDVGRFAPHSRKLHEFVHGGRNFTTVACQEHVAAALNTVGFLAIETSGLNIPGQLVEVGRGIVRRRTVLLKQTARDGVDALIGTLGGQNRGNQEFQGRGEVQGALCIRIGLLQQRYDVRQTLLTVRQGFCRRRRQGRVLTARRRVFGHLICLPIGATQYLESR